jgi:ribosomal protein L7Ae-like RNA K-turn-binding protein
LHRTAADVWNERHFQHRVENSWEGNANDVADAVNKLLANGPAKLVVIAGDVRARHLIADALGSPAGVTVRVIEEGGRAAGSSAEALQAAVHDAVLKQVWRERREVLEHLQQNLGRQEYAVAGVSAVVDALRMSQVDTLVISDDPSSPLTAWVGPGATDFGIDESEPAALGVSSVQHDRLDAALVRAAVGTNARLVITPGAHGYLPEGIGALLRFDTAS